MRRIDQAVIHCAATPNGRHFDIEAIDSWHRKRGWHRPEKARQIYRPELTSVGYHFVIYLNGAIAFGRHVSEVGAHVRGHNSHSVGICMIGTDQFTVEQWESLRLLSHALQKEYPQVEFLGHRDFPNVRKTCPGFDVSAWLADGMTPNEECVL